MIMFPAARSGVEERSDGASRYPKRNLPKTDYSTIESPEEDDFICKSSNLSNDAYMKNI